MVKAKSKTVLSRQARIFVILIVLIANVGCDQVSKSIVREKVSLNEQISLMGDYLTLTKIENPGAFLSIGILYRNRSN
jgi:signal peptidase II